MHSGKQDRGLLICLQMTEQHRHIVQVSRGRMMTSEDGACTGLDEVETETLFEQSTPSEPCPHPSAFFFDHCPQAIYTFGCLHPNELAIRNQCSINQSEVEVWNCRGHWTQPDGHTFLIVSRLNITSCYVSVTA
jgi:hypothetical protein